MDGPQGVEKVLRHEALVLSIGILVPDVHAATEVGVVDALLAHLNAGTELGDFAPKLTHNVDKARLRKVDAEGLCRASNVKKTKKRLQQATKELTLYVHRLNGLAARKKLDPAVRQLFVDKGTPIQRDLMTLRGALRCPDDAPPA